MECPPLWRNICGVNRLCSTPSVSARLCKHTHTHTLCLWKLQKETPGQPWLLNGLIHAFPLSISFLSTLGFARVKHRSQSSSTAYAGSPVDTTWWRAHLVWDQPTRLHPASRSRPFCQGELGHDSWVSLAQSPETSGDARRRLGYASLPVWHTYQPWRACARFLSWRRAITTVATS